MNGYAAAGVRSEVLDDAEDVGEQAETHFPPLDPPDPLDPLVPDRLPGEGPRGRSRARFLTTFLGGVSIKTHVYKRLSELTSFFLGSCR